MFQNDLPARDSSRLASATGGVGLLGIVCISMFYIIAGPFGTLNDVCNAVGALLSGAMAWRLYPWHRARAPEQSRLALGAAGLGMLIAVAGSVLVISRRTGWYLAGLYSTFGFALIGIWLLALVQAAQRTLAWPRRLVQFGRLTGAAMAVGLLALPGILRGVDTPGAAPWWAHAGYLGSLGWFFLAPVWWLWLGRVLGAREAARPEPARG